MPSEISQQIRATFVKTNAPLEIPIEVERHQWEENALQVLLPDGTTIEPVMINGISCERVYCSEVTSQCIMLFLHGGGFNSGSCKTHRELAARLSLATGIPVLTIDYRLAPEHPFPAGIEDVCFVYRSLLKNGSRPDEIVFGGDSAGGGLALSALLSLRASDTPMPAAAVLLSPWLDLSLSGDSMKTRAALDPLTSYDDLLKAVQLYIGVRDPTDPLASPVYADLSALPPLLLHVGDHEVLLSDSTRLAKNAKAARVEVVLEIWPEMWHVFHAWGTSLPEAQQALGQIGKYVRDKLHL